MWRFVVVSCAFLGWSFYELSGGSDYAPANDSLQVALEGKALFAAPIVVARIDEEFVDDGALPAPIMRRTKVRKNKPKPTRAEITAAEEEAVALAMASLSSLSNASIDRFSVTLATAPDADQDLEEFGLSLNGIGGFSGEALALAVAEDPPVVDASVTETIIQAPQPEPADMRRISRDVANMRDGPGTSFAKVDQLTAGTVVEVLETADNGWLRLKVMHSGSEGWMADWLVTASN